MVALSNDFVLDPGSTAGSGSVSVRFEPDQAVAVLAGEVDATLSAELERASTSLLEAGLPVRFDLTAVLFIDSVGLNVIARAVRDGQSRPTVVGASRLVLHTITLAGLSSEVDLVES